MRQFAQEVMRWMLVVVLGIACFLAAVMSPTLFIAPQQGDAVSPFVRWIVGILVVFYSYALPILAFGLCISTLAAIVKVLIVAARQK
jgi:hypothetical protein